MANVVYKTPVNNVLTLSTDEKQQSEISNNTTINLPNISAVTDFTLYLKCGNDVDVTFHTDSDNQTIKMLNGYHKIEFSYIGDWIIRC